MSADSWEIRWAASRAAWMACYLGVQMVVHWAGNSDEQRAASWADLWAVLTASTTAAMRAGTLDASSVAQTEIHWAVSMAACWAW